MAEKLSITIALEGGKAIEQQLEGIGKAGKKAFDDIAAAAQQAGGFKNLKPEEVTAKLKEMGLVGTEAFNKISTAVENATRMERLVGVVRSVETGFSGLVTAATGFARALGPIGLAAAAALPKLISLMNEAAEAIHKVDSAAIKAGLSIEQFDKLRQGFERAGLSAKEVESALGKIAAAADKAKLAQVIKDIDFLQDKMRAGLVLPRAGQEIGVGVEQIKRLIEAAQGTGKAADEAKQALNSWKVSLADTPKTLSEMIAKVGDTSKGVAAFVEQLRTMPDSASRSKLAIDGFGDAAVRLVQALREGRITEDQFKLGVADLGTITGKMASDVNKSELALNQMSTAWDRFKTTGDVSQLGVIWDAFWLKFGSDLDQSIEQLSRFGGKFRELASTAGSAIWDPFKAGGLAAIEAISNAWDALMEKFANAGSAIANALRSIAAGGGTPGSVTPIPGNAAGGMIGGRGSGTSDSNLAWVSRGEHIMPAAAVAQPGVLALLEALRRSGGNLRGVLDGMGRFAAGGVVPRFAAGGLVGGMGHLGTVDLRTDHGSVTLMASGSAVDQLSRLAVTKRMTSTGRKPGFIG